MKSLSLGTVIVAVLISAVPAMAQNMTQGVSAQQFALLKSDLPLRSGTPTREELVSVLTRPIRQLDVDGNGLDRDDATAQVKAIQSQVRAQVLASFLPFDLDGDLQVTELEMERVSRISGRTVVEQLFTRHDTDADGVLTLQEMMTLPPTGPGSGYGASEGERLLNAVALFKTEWGSRFTLEDANTLTDMIFDSLDADGNGIIDTLELRGDVVVPSAMGHLDVQRPIPIHTAEGTTSGSHCTVPTAPPDAEVVLVGAYEGKRYSSVHFGDITEDVGYAEVHVEKGSKPLYVLLTDYTPIVWDFTGDVSRVSNVVVGGFDLGGVVGIPKEKIAFLEARRCLSYAYDFRSDEGITALRQAERLIRRGVTSAGGTYALERISLPSMVVDNPSSHSGLDRRHVDIDPESVVAATKVIPFQVLPGQSGLRQLVADGYAETTDDRVYRIIKPIPHFPAGLHGGYSVRFLIAKGVPMPNGDPGHSCVIMEESGQTLGLTC